MAAKQNGAPSDVPGGDRPLRAWHDRRGRTHCERRASPHGDDPFPPKVAGPLERAWQRVDRREQLAREALARQNPLIDPDPDDAGLALWTWVVEAPDARAVVLWTNPFFDHRDVGASELVRLPGSALWTICLRLPRALRASYRIGIWREDGPPPWRGVAGRRQVLLAAMAACGADARCPGTVRGSRGEVSSVAAGPDAPVELWRGHESGRPAGSGVEELPLPGGERAWIWSPDGAAEATPLLVLFDGQVWMGMGLPAILDAAVAGGVLPPLHVAMLDSHDPETRWDRLGVPCGQVDTVIDHLLPLVRSRWRVDPRGEATIVAGQSLGGIAALWTLALGDGEVQHAIAQSASLWRFDVAEALLTEPAWRSIVLQAGAFEGDMLSDARALGRSLHEREADRRSVRVEGFEAGHDWASWRANIVGALADLLPRLTGDHL
jgi:enterochelin esterase family protein